MSKLQTLKDRLEDCKRVIPIYQSLIPEYQQRIDNPKDDIDKEVAKTMLEWVKDSLMFRQYDIPRLQRMIQEEIEHPTVEPPKPQVYVQLELF